MSPGLNGIETMQNPSYTKTAKHIKRNAAYFLMHGLPSRDYGGLCCNFTHFDNGIEREYIPGIYSGYDYIMAWMGEELAGKYLGPKGQMSEARILMCKHLTGMSIRTLRRHIAAAIKAVNNGSLSKEPMSGFKYLAKVDNIPIV